MDSRERNKVFKIAEAIFECTESLIQTGNNLECVKEIQGLAETLRDIAQGNIPLPSFNCWVTVKDGVLMSCPMAEGGEVDLFDGEPNWCEVTAPGSQEFLDAVNHKLGTSFKIEDFAR